MRATHVPYKVGDVILHNSFGIELRHVRVDEIRRNIKNGKPGFMGVAVAGPIKDFPVWGYSHEVEKVLTPSGWSEVETSTD